MTGLTKNDWRAIARRIQRGKCTPIIGNRLCMRLLPRFDVLASAWAEEIEYPLGDDYTLTRLAQYLSVSVGDNTAKEEFLTFVKAYAIAQRSGRATAQIIDKIGPRLIDASLTQIATKMGYMGNARSEKNPLTTLARLPIPVYITTSYHSFIESALQRLQKKPRVDSCTWLDTQRESTGSKSTSSLTVLHKLVLQYFNISELQDICFQLSVDFEMLEGSEKTSKVRELILYMQRHNRLPELVKMGRQRRPHVRWPEISSAMAVMIGQTAVRPSIFKQNPNYRPTPKEPLVYHLFGQETDPDSIVLTEDNYLDFLMRISQEKQLIPPVVAQSLEDSSLLLMGYRINNWDFRTLFRGLITSRRGSRREISIAIQLEPDQYSREAQNYLEHYFREVEFKVYWGSAQDFLNEILNYLH